MKLEALQSLSVVVMFVGLFLSVLGGFGAYFFSGGSERTGRGATSAHVEPATPDKPAEKNATDSPLATLTEPISEVTARQLSLIPEPTLAPLPDALLPATEELPEPKLEPIPIPAPMVAKATPPEKKEPAHPVAEKSHTPATPVPASPAPVVANATSPEKKPAATPLPEKAPAPAPVIAVDPPKPAKVEPAIVAAKAPTPAPKHPEAVSPRTPELGIEAWQKEKLLQRLRTFPNGSISIQTPEGHGEAMAFATALKEAFIAAGWHVTGLTAVKTDREPHGLTLSSGTFPPPPEVTTIFSALISAGMKLSTDLDPSLSKKHAILFVGSRP